MSSSGLLLLAFGSLSSSKTLDFLLSQREYFLWYLTWASLCVLAYVTNPTAATFRTHLTSLSFESHLRRLSSPTLARAEALQQSSNGSRKGIDSSKEGSGHILSFSNRISLSIRTPPYSVRSYFLFSTVVMAAAPRTELIDKMIHFDEDDGQIVGVWIGAFGRWYAWNAGGEEQQEEARKLRLDRGVVLMKAQDVEPIVPTPPTPSTPVESEVPSTPISPVHTSTSSSHSHRLPRSTKRVMRQGERRPSPTSLARLRSRTESASAAVALASSPIPSTTGHVKTQSEGEGFYTTRSPKDRGLPGLPFHVSRNPIVPGHFVTEPDQSDTEMIDAVAGSSVVEDLKLQLEELKKSSESSENKLTVELELLKDRKKAEDEIRAELKAKTKLLEEEKRVGELSKVESEKSLGEQRLALKKLEESVERVNNEIAQIDRRELELVERKEKKKRDKKEREKKMREDIVKKKEELQLAQLSLEKMKTKTTGLGFTLESRREVLIAKKNEMAARGFIIDQDYRRGNGMLAYHPGMTSSRPSSRNFNNQGGHSSAPTSPSISYRTSGYEYDYIPDHYGTTTDPSFYGNNFIHPTNATGFLEHRIQHRQHASVNSIFVPLAGSLPSTESIQPKFLPFNFDFDDSPGPIEPIPLPSNEVGSNLTQSLSNSRPQLSLPLQYLESGLLSGAEEPSNYIPMSPVTPHQTSLIPRELLSMIDADDDEEVVSPSLSSTLGAGEGLGLEVMDLEGTGWEGMNDSNRFNGVNLNPDAKTFQFSTGGSSRNPIQSHSSKGSLSRLDYNLFEDLRPIKSRMDFAFPSAEKMGSSSSTTGSAFKFDPFSDDDV